MSEITKAIHLIASEAYEQGARDFAKYMIDAISD